uniref:MYND-type domain-containing protein n=1 Tax=Salarias fasciatus TaxID=181472 RepID=A0A672IHW9_SALFA
MNKGHKGSSRTSKINPLALPKGTEKFCELCGKVARLQCAACQVTFYCDAEHQQADWVGIHKRICQLLVQIRDPGSHPTQSNVELIEICRFEAGSKLSQGKHQEALPAAQSGLRCLTDVHGSGSCELVPAYLLLAEANMGLGNISRVKELLSQAEWVVSKSPECTNEIHHRLHRSLGRLHVLTGDLEAALFHFANDIYYAAEAFGLESMVISRGYFLMAGVFVKQGKSPVASSLYSEVVRSWHAHLTELLQSHINSPDFSYGMFYNHQMCEIQAQCKARNLVFLSASRHLLAAMQFPRLSGMLTAGKKKKVATKGKDAYNKQKIKTGLDFADLNLLLFFKCMSGSNDVLSECAVC